MNEVSIIIIGYIYVSLWRIRRDFHCDNCLKNEYLAYPFDAVVFRFGYTKRIMVYRIQSISIGQGRTEWGAPKNKETFIIKLKERLL